MLVILLPFSISGVYNKPQLFFTACENELP